MERFCSEEVQRNAGVNSKNRYVFPATGNSRNCADEWHAVHDTVCKDGLSSERANLFTALRIRHFVSTSLDNKNVPEGVIQLFFQHMGHSMRTNLKSYQAALGTRTINSILPLLLNMKGGNVSEKGLASSTLDAAGKN